jgi:hypothetical protein
MQATSLQCQHIPDRTEEKVRRHPQPSPTYIHPFMQADRKYTPFPNPAAGPLACIRPAVEGWHDWTGCVSIPGRQGKSRQQGPCRQCPVTCLSLLRVVAGALFDGNRKQKYVFTTCVYLLVASRIWSRYLSPDNDRCEEVLPWFLISVLVNRSKE